MTGAAWTTYGPPCTRVPGCRSTTATSEWIWRPLHNPDTLQISAFVDPSPRGFGLLQRDRDYAAFLDDDQNFERRPSLWIEPIGEWGPGLVQLIEIPTDNEINDNVLCLLAAEAATGGRSGGELRVSAVLVLAAARATEPATRYRNTRWARPNGVPSAGSSSILSGEALKSTQALLGNEGPMLSASPGTVSNLRVWPYPERKMCRVGFDLEHW